MSVIDCQRGAIYSWGTQSPWPIKPFPPEARTMSDSTPPTTSATHVESMDAIGYRGATACIAAGITYRQLDYWARTDLVVPSVQGATGSGSQRLYGFRDILVLKIVKRLLDTGVSLQNIRTAVEHLRGRGVKDLEAMTLMSDGASIFECTTADDIVDLLKGGQGVFGIAIGKVWSEVEGSLATLQGESTHTGSVMTGASGEGNQLNDELSERRKRRGA